MGTGSLTSRRWVPIAVVTAALVAVNLVARLVVRLRGTEVGPDALESAEFVVGLWSLWSLGAMGLCLAVAAFLWTRRHALGRVVADLVAVILAGSLLVSVVGPYVSGSGPLESGFSFFLLLFLFCVAVLTVGATIGSLLAIAFGLDPKSRAWQAYARGVKMPQRAAKGGSGKRPARR